MIILYLISLIFSIINLYNAFEVDNTQAILGWLCSICWVINLIYIEVVKWVEKNL